MGYGPGADPTLREDSDESLPDLSEHQRPKLRYSPSMTLAHSPGILRHFSGAVALTFGEG